MKHSGLASAICLGIVLFFAAHAHANDFGPQMRAYLDTHVRPVLAEPMVIDAIKAQNARTHALSDAEITALDRTWRNEAKAGEGQLIGATLQNELSKRLRAFKSGADGLIAEIFVMDARGLNVGQADVTSDYMQGDEPKWQKTFAAGPQAVFVDEIDYDDSSKTFLAQISATIVDPADGKPIGAVTVGLAVERLP